MKYLHISLVTILLLPVGCKKDMPSINLPPITQEGKNTVGFLLDDEVWVPFARCGYFADPCDEISARYGPPYRSYNKLSFQIEREIDDLSSALTITSLVQIKQAGEYYDSVHIEFLSEEQDINLNSYTKSSTYPDGKFTITRLDTVARVMAGTFNFTLRNREGETVEITEGRFDFEMNACICR